MQTFDSLKRASSFLPTCVLASRQGCLLTVCLVFLLLSQQLTSACLSRALSETLRMPTGEHQAPHQWAVEVSVGAVLSGRFSLVGSSLVRPRIIAGGQSLAFHAEPFIPFRSPGATEPGAAIPESALDGRRVDSIACDERAPWDAIYCDIELGIVDGESAVLSLVGKRRWVPDSSSASSVSARGEAISASAGSETAQGRVLYEGTSSVPSTSPLHQVSSSVYFVMECIDKAMWSASDRCATCRRVQLMITFHPNMSAGPAFNSTLPTLRTLRLQFTRHDKGSGGKRNLGRRGGNTLWGSGASLWMRWGFSFVAAAGMLGTLSLVGRLSRWGTRQKSTQSA